MNVRGWRQFDFSLGVQDATTWLLKKPNELQRGINLKFTEKVGGFQRRAGFVREGEQFSTVPNPPQGGHVAKFSTGARRFVAVNNDAGTATVIRVQDTGDGTWADLSDLPVYPADTILFFLDYLDEVYVSGFDPATKDPVQPINIDKDLDVSTTRNILHAPWGYFWCEYLGLLYMANVDVNGERHKDRIYKSSPPLGAMTFVQGAQTDELTEIDLIDNIPKMTSNTAPSGVAAASTIANSSNDAYRAMDDNLTNKWTANATTGWLRYDFGSGNDKVITHYSIVGQHSDGTTGDTQAPKDWTFEGSNDASAWTVIDTQTNVATWASEERRVYTTTNETSYRYYRLNITANQGHGTLLKVTEFELLTSLQTSQSLFLKVDSVRYLKPNMEIDIYKAGTETKLYDMTVDAVDKNENTFTFAPHTYDLVAADFDTATDTVTIPDSAKFPTGTPLKFSSAATLPAGLTADTIYYSINTSATTLKVATSYNYAVLGEAVDITDTGTAGATHKIHLSYVLEDNDEIWLDGTKGKLNLFWNTDYPTPQTTGEFLHIKPGTDASPTISGVGVSANRMFIFTKNSATRYDSQNLVVFNHSIGCISHRSIQNIDDDWLIWVDAKGNIRARSENMGAQENISRAIRNPWMRKLTMEQKKAINGSVVDEVYKAYIGEVEGKHMRVVYDFEANAWSPEHLAYPPLIQFSDDLSGELKPYFLSNNGRLYQDETGNLDDDKPIPFLAGTGRDMFGAEQTKRFVGMLLFTRNCSGLRLQAAVDGGQMETIGIIEGVVCYIEFPQNGDNKLPLGVSFDWQIAGNLKGEPPEVEGAVVYYSPEETYPSAKQQPR